MCPQYTDPGAIFSSLSRAEKNVCYYIYLCSQGDEGRVQGAIQLHKFGAKKLITRLTPYTFSAHRLYRRAHKIMMAQQLKNLASQLTKDGTF